MKKYLLVLFLTTQSFIAQACSCSRYEFDPDTMALVTFKVLSDPMADNGDTSIKKGDYRVRVKVIQSAPHVVSLTQVHSIMGTLCSINISKGGTTTVVMFKSEKTGQFEDSPFLRHCDLPMHLKK